MVKLLCFLLHFFFFRGLGGLDYSFHTLAKKYCNFLMHSLIDLKCGTNKELIKENSGREFGVNLISIQCVRRDDSCKKLLSC